MQHARQENTMNKPILLLVTSMLFASLPVSGKEIAGVDIADSLTLSNNGDALVLNGAGIRKKFFMSIYIGALYLPANSPDARAIISDTGPASVLMHFLYSEVSKEKITGGWEDGLKANLPSTDLQALRPRLDKFNLLFRTVHQGDVIRIDYLPGMGTEVRINGEWRGVVAGNDFFRALLKVWLGASPVSSSLKKAMLGLD
jgi:hypothetical protein